MADSGTRSLPATHILDVLSSLDEDDRLKNIFDGEPVKALVVGVEDGRFAVTIAPGIELAAAERQIFAAALREAFSAVEADVAPQPAPAQRDRQRDRAANARPHLIAARSHLDSGNPGRALEVIDAALARWANNVDLLTYRALALAGLGHPAQAVDAYREVIRHSQSSAFAHAGAAQLLARMRRWEDAKTHAASALSLEPGDPSSLHVLALANEHLELYEEALDAMRRALEVDPELPDGDDDLERIERAAQQPDVEVVLLDTEVSPGTQDAESVEVVLDVPQQQADPDSPAPPSDVTDEERGTLWAVATQRSSMADERKCQNCNATNPPRTSFCVQCGNRLSEGPSPA